MLCRVMNSVSFPSSLISQMHSRDDEDSMKRSEERLTWRQKRWNKRPRNDPKEINPYGLEDIVRHVTFKDEYPSKRKNLFLDGASQGHIIRDGLFVYKGGSSGSSDAGRSSSSRRHRDGGRSKYSNGGGSGKSSRNRRRNR